MKNLYLNSFNLWLLGFVIFALLMFALPSIAQISAGGTPPSFSQNLTGIVPTVKMPTVDTRTLLLEDEESGNDPFRFATQIDVSLNLKNSGIWETLSNGDRVWRLRISSPEAYSIGFLYDVWFIPKGGQLFLYNDDHSMVIGAFTAFNNWETGKNITQHVAGDAVTLEYLEPVSITRLSRLSIFKVCHAYRNLFGHRSLDSFGASDTCEHNINCPEFARWHDEKQGVAMIIYNNSWQCSGSVINPYTPTYMVYPYFLTANHCVSGHPTDSLWLFYFNYESPGCVSQNGPLNQTMANAHLRANWNTSDFALFQFSAPPPEAYNVYMNGWDRSGATPDSVVGIHHPAGDIKKISVERHAPTIEGWQSCNAAQTHWRMQHWELGSTEGGSSGSPLFSSYGSAIIGQLSGYCYSCNCPLCKSYYGRLSNSWVGGGHTYDGLRHWLDPDSTNVTSCLGMYFYFPDNDVCPGTTIASIPFMGGGSTVNARNDWTNCVGAYSQDLFYNYTPSCDMTITVSLCTANYNTGLGVYSLPMLGDCFWSFLIGCNDNNTLCADTTHSQLTFEASGGVKYLFDVHGSDLSSGTFILVVTGVNHVVADSCPGITITSLPFSHFGDTRCSVNNYNNCAGPGSRDEVFTFTASETQAIMVSLCGSNYDTGLEVRTRGICPGDSQVACNDDNAGCANTLHSQIVFQANSGSTYYFVVHGFANNAGTYRLQVYVMPTSPIVVIKPFPPLINLWWQHVSGATIYHVYRDTTADIVPSTTNLIGSVPDTMYIDPDALMTSNMKFFYVVTAEVPMMQDEDRNTPSNMDNNSAIPSQSKSIPKK